MKIKCIGLVPFTSFFILKVRTAFVQIFKKYFASTSGPETAGTVLEVTIQGEQTVLHLEQLQSEVLEMVFTPEKEQYPVGYASHDKSSMKNLFILYSEF